ncbi:MAG: phosphoribosylformylglycinamidine synthase [Synergistaceae bacterium]|nr:phosphoribosylformylglycinamidine synthase [Synergistaceae bacterium]
MVHRLFTSRKDKHNPEALSLLQELRNISGLEQITRITIYNRYDVQGLTDEQLSMCRDSVFAEPFTDIVSTSLPNDADYVLAVEYLPGQYDQRADAAEQCIMLLTGTRPIVRTARVYLFQGTITNPEALRKFFINPVESREAQLAEYSSLGMNYSLPEDVKTVQDYSSLHGLAMSPEDLDCIRKYFASEGRQPTQTEIKVLDTYWSDHCRHTTFLTHIDGAEIHDGRVRAAYDVYLSLRKELGREDKPITLMDIATIGAKYLHAKGLLPDLVISDENNACTVRMNLDGEKWLLLFKNETHNHPTEIEPFGGAATCIGGAIRDPLSGRAYVYQAMRITGASDPSRPAIPGKLPQRTIITKAAQGYSSYGNQIGLPTGLVDEIYHPGYTAKRLEVGAVIAAVPETNVIRETPAPGDAVLLLGGRTGRDGIGGATGSSVSHTASSLDTCGAEVQKGNAPEERKLQRLFRNPEFSRLIKKCNDFGAGGVSVAVGELADGLDIDLDAVPLKYAGLDGTEIAVSESQERMAVVVGSEDVDAVKALALAENVEATVIARVNNSGRMRMKWRGKEIVNLSRDFIDSNGASRHIDVTVKASSASHSHAQKFPDVLGSLNACSRQGLAERFDSTVGAHSVLMPFGGKYQRTPAQVMAAKIPGAEGGTCSLMSWGFDPYISEASTFDGAYCAVVESLCKIIAAGGNLRKCWLTLQEYFGKPEHDSVRWGLPFGALLGALKAQLDFGVAAIGGKDSMSGSFTTQNGERLDVPPTLISFAVSVADVKRVVSPEFKRAGSHVVMLSPEYDSHGLPEKDSLLRIFAQIEKLNSEGKLLACAAVGTGGVKAQVFRMCIGNNLGFEFTGDVPDDERRGRFIVEVTDSEGLPECAGLVIENPEIIIGSERFALDECMKIYDSPLAKVFPVDAEISVKIPDVKVKYELPCVKYSLPAVMTPRFVIPVFPGTNCEYETARAIERVGGKAEVFVVRTLTPGLMRESAEEFAALLRKSNALVLPGGFSSGDEPDGSGKFIAIFLRSPVVREALEDLLNNREGLVCGICNGFQALVKTGLLPFGRICEPEELEATLTFNAIGRHQSRIIRSRVITNNSPWLRKYEVGDVLSMPISHGEGRFVCSEKMFTQLMKDGQVAGQYADVEGNVSMRISDNPSGSMYAVECLTSPDGRILGRMGHAERVGEGLYVNVPGKYDLRFFGGACEYFRKV